VTANTSACNHHGFGTELSVNKNCQQCA